MSFILSTGLVNYLAAHGSLREAFDDCVLNIYSGAVPVTAEEAPGSGLLCPITIGSVAVAATDRSTPVLYKLTVGGTYGGTAIAKIKADEGAAATTAYEKTLAAGDTTLALATMRIAAFLNDILFIDAVPSDLGTDGIINIKGRINGLDITIASNTPTGVTLTFGTKVPAVPVAALRFGPPTIGVINIAGGVWSGVNVATGVASFFRFVRPDDQGNSAGGSTALRLQGTISTSGADMNLSNTTLTISATTTIDSGNFQEPKSE